MSMPLLKIIWNALDLPEAALQRIVVNGDANLPSAFPVTDLAASSVGAAALAVSELIGTTGAAPAVSVDRRLSSLWFGWSIQPQGWPRADVWDPLAGDYLAKDGWIKIHTNAAHHRAAALKVLACDESRDSVVQAVKTWSASDLETAIVEAGGCAASLRPTTAWLAHPQGRAVSAEPLIAFKPSVGAQPSSSWRPDRVRPLRGLKVLDLTRILAGPVATRFLAGYGADVLRIDPPDWEEPGVIPEVTLGKRCAHLDLRQPQDRATFERLLASADVFVHGYRQGALDGLGYGEAQRRALNPALLDVALDAYGWSGRGRSDGVSTVWCNSVPASPMSACGGRARNIRCRCRCRRSITPPAI